MIDRRQFLGSAAASAAALSSTTAKSYARILGSNNRVNFAVIGLRSRAYAHLAALYANKDNAQIITVADVDSRYLDKFCGDATTKMGAAPKAERDFRNALANKDVDAIRSLHRTIGTHPWASWACRPASMCTWRSPARTTCRKACGWLKRRRRPASCARWDRSAALRSR